MIIILTIQYIIYMSFLVFYFQANLNKNINSLHRKIIAYSFAQHPVPAFPAMKGERHW